DSPIELQWDYTGTTISTVDILVDLDGDDDWTDATVVQPGVAVAAGKTPATYTTVNSLPTALSPNAKIRVRDSAAAFQDLVAGDSAGFVIIGQIEVNPPNSLTQWVVGTGPQNINWSYKGDIGDVRIWVDYDGNETFDIGTDDELESRRAITAKPFPWATIPDKVSVQAKICVQSLDLLTEVKDFSEPFDIAGKFEDLTVTPAAGDDEVVAGKAGSKITWTRTGIAITEVLLEYSFDGSNWNPLDDELGTVGWVNNTGVYNWTPLDTDIDETCWVKISDPNNSAATDSFGDFKMVSMIDVYKPDANNVGPNAWESGTTKRISWSKYGDFANVKIYYSPDGSDWSHEIDSAVTKSSNTDLGDVDGGGAGTEDGYYDYDWAIDDTVTLSPTAKIMVKDVQHPTASIPGVSDQFTTKGNVEVLLPDGTGEGGTGNYVAGEQITLRWKRWGNITGVNVYYYSAASGEVPIPSLQGIDFVSTEHQVTWTPPEIVGTNYVIRVKDKGNETETQDDSEPFILEGKLAITDPNGQGETMFIRKPADALKTITWDVVHGNIQNVKIIGTRTGTFPDPATDFVVIDSTDADNVLTFSASNFGTEGCVARGSYDWNIEEKSLSIISETIRLKVLDENTDYSVESDPSSATFKIRGQIVVDTPALDWKVNGTSEEITWTAYGDIQNVLIKFDNGTAPVDVVNPETGMPSGAGAKTFSVTDWTYNSYPGTVPDEKSLNCTVEVIDFSNANVNNTSGVFYTYPEITDVIV
ncbi:MAG: hypothetical protein KAI72_01015, partial [Candidatus Pacebacteria bacterium]|nr:hypothetical protein [Candidatus Paceibacterota bacterium]